jgi:hypothetical protein
MRFVLDDLPWSATASGGPSWVDAFEALAERLRTATQRCEGVTAYDAVYEASRLGVLTLSDILFVPEHAFLPADLARELRILVDRIPTFGDEAVEATDVSIGAQGPHFSPSVAWAHRQAAGGRVVACITPSASGRRGPIDVAESTESRPLHFVCDESSHVEFFRAVVVEENADRQAFEALVGSAYPGIDFADGALGGLNDLSVSFRARRDDIMRHFAVLSDHGREIFELSRNQAIENGFAKRGITISLENTETRNDTACRNARTKSYRGASLFFEWHAKIELHIDRIHVHPGVPASDGRVIVGVLHKHLPLPGD